MLNLSRGVRYKYFKKDLYFMKKKTINSQKISYIHELSLGICKILFKKETNGRYRAIFGTLNKDMIPGKYQKTLIDTLKSRENSNLVPIFDIKSGEWKSFYIKNVISFSSAEKLKSTKKY
jgi:hypothetical protein